MLLDKFDSKQRLEQEQDNPGFGGRQHQALLIVFISTDGAVGTKLTNKILNGKEIRMQDIDEVYNKKLEASKQDILKPFRDLSAATMCICSKSSVWRLPVCSRPSKA
jgi:hypothetical protein